MDLFDRGYWWEAHEWWEASWHATDDNALRRLLQGLIQLAAAWLKWVAGNERGRQGLWSRSREHLLAATVGEPHPAGLDVLRLVDRVDRWFDAHSICSDGSPGDDFPKLSPLH